MKLTREEQVQMLAALIRDGLLKTRGRWYEVSDLLQLAEHVRRQVQAVRVIRRNGRAVLVRFYRPRKAARF